MTQPGAVTNWLPHFHASRVLFLDSLIIILLVRTFIEYFSFSLHATELIFTSAPVEAHEKSVASRRVRGERRSHRKYCNESPSFSVQLTERCTVDVIINLACTLYTIFSRFFFLETVIHERLCERGEKLSERKSLWKIALLWLRAVRKLCNSLWCQLFRFSLLLRAN